VVYRISGYEFKNLMSSNRQLRNRFVQFAKESLEFFDRQTRRNIKGEHNIEGDIDAVRLTSPRESKEMPKVNNRADGLIGVKSIADKLGLFPQDKIKALFPKSISFQIDVKTKKKPQRSMEARG
jgi:hypothetical protein